MRTVGIMALAAALFASGNLHADGAHSGARVTTLMQQPLADYPAKLLVLFVKDQGAPPVLPPAQH